MLNIAAPLALFAALASAVLAAASAGKTSGIIALTAETKPVDAVVPELHLRTTLAAVNGTLHPFKARGVRIQFDETSTSEVVWVASAPSRCLLWKFSLRGVSGHTLEGCGGGLCINQKGKFYVDCVPFSESDSCGVHTEWTCL